MRNAFYFIRTPDNQFIWTDNKTYRFVWKNPKIQAFDYYMFLNSQNDILYYYYDFSIYQFCENDWKEIVSVRTHDFPCIRTLSEDISYFMGTEITEYAEYQNKTKIYEEKLEYIPPFAFDDFYQLKRCLHTETFQEWYSVSLGAYTKSVSLDNITFEEFVELQDCIDSFISYSCECYQQKTAKMHEFNSRKHICKEHKLYVCKLDQQGNPTGCYTNAFCIGDKFSSFHALPEDTLAVCSLSYHHATLSQIENNHIILSDIHNKQKRIPVKHIQYISGDFFDKVTWNISQMAQEFQTTLSEPELTAFQKKSVTSLTRIYAEIIISRYAIYRPEHGLVANYPAKNEERADMARSAVEKIISEIKQNLI